MDADGKNQKNLSNNDFDELGFPHGLLTVNGLPLLPGGMGTGKST